MRYYAVICLLSVFFFFSSRRRHTRCSRDWSSDVCSSDLKANDPEPYYWVGVIDWTLAFRANNELRAEYNKNNIKKQVKDTDPLPSSVRAQYTAKYGSLVDEGISALKKAIELGPGYYDALAYLNLMYRRKADMVESADQRDDLLKQADAPVDKVKEVKQKRAEQPQPAN